MKRDFDYSGEEVSNIMEKVFAFVTLVTPKKKVQVVKDDPDDDKFLEVAVEGDADYIVSQDKHLLKIEELEGVKIVNPWKFLRMLDYNSE